MYKRQLDNLIRKADDEKKESDVSEEDQELLRQLFEAQLPKEDKVMISVQTGHQGSDAKPILLVQGEYMRRMKEMAAMQQGMNFYGEMPDSYVPVSYTHLDVYKRQT